MKPMSYSEKLMSIKRDILYSFYHETVVDGLSDAQVNRIIEEMRERMANLVNYEDGNND
jgi:hypothetical protein